MPEEGKMSARRSACMTMVWRASPEARLSLKESGNALVLKSSGERRGTVVDNRFRSVCV